MHVGLSTQLPVRRWGSTLRLWLTLGLLALAACDSGGSSSSPAMSMVSGSVFGGQPVAGARVSFIDAFSAGSSSSVQPLEDLAAGAAFQTVTTGDGQFSVTVEAGRYFIFVTPAPEDTLHLPGGSLSRKSVVLGEGSTTVLDITLSERPSESAEYVGSSRCLGCHGGLTGITQTLHFVGLRALTAARPGLSSLQDLSAFPDANAGVSYYSDGNPNDNTGPGDDLGFRVVTGQSYNILLGRDATGFFQALESLDGLRVSAPLYAEFTYGGEGRFRQLYVTRLDRSGAYTADPIQGSYHLLPGQFSETRGDPARGNEVTVPGWTTYHPERWAAPAAAGAIPGMTPARTESFDNSCAGCHFTGMSLTRNADGLFQAHAAADPGGPLDFDGDGLLDEMNVGCERCHGPGSEHVAGPPGSIVQPEYLSPGRANVLCGQCHINGQGNGTIAGEGQGDYPSRSDPETGDIEFVHAGISAAQFFGTDDGTGILPDFGTRGGFFNPIDLTQAPGSWMDESGGHGSQRDHSRESNQHYLDHARSKHSRNAFEMVTCWDCHDSHAIERTAQVSEPVEDNVLCLRCHAGQAEFAGVTQEMVDVLEAGGGSSPELREATNEHVVQRTFDLIGVAMNLGSAVYGNPGGDDRLGRCIVCHMPRTARSGSWVEDDEGFQIRGDVASHTFDNISPDVSESMALAELGPVPNSCVDCHRGLVRGSWPDYRFKED